MSRVVKRALHLWAHCQATSKVLEWCEVSGQTVCPPPSRAQSVGCREGRWGGGISVDPIRPTTCFLKVEKLNPSLWLSGHESHGSLFSFSKCIYLFGWSVHVEGKSDSMNAFIPTKKKNLEFLRKKQNNNSLKLLVTSFPACRRYRSTGKQAGWCRMQMSDLNMHGKWWVRMSLMYANTCMQMTKEMLGVGGVGHHI